MALSQIESIKKRVHTSEVYSKWYMLRTLPVQEFLPLQRLRLMIQVKNHTMLSYIRLAKLFDLAKQIQSENVDGNFVECGVWNGGSAGIVAAALKNDRNRLIWLFDSWEGLPEPSVRDLSFRGEPGVKGAAHGDENRVRELLFHKLGFDYHKIQLIKGWYENTLALTKPKINQIAMLHLDCDWYASVKLALDELYDQVTPRGVIVLDDYGYWAGCRIAADEFIAKRRLQVRLAKIDSTAVYFEKP